MCCCSGKIADSGFADPEDPDVFRPDRTSRTRYCRRLCSTPSSYQCILPRSIEWAGGLIETKSDCNRGGTRQTQKDYSAFNVNVPASFDNPFAISLDLFVGSTRAPMRSVACSIRIQAQCKVITGEISGDHSQRHAAARHGFNGIGLLCHAGPCRRRFGIGVGLELRQRPDSRIVVVTHSGA